MSEETMSVNWGWVSRQLSGQQDRVKEVVVATLKTFSDKSDEWLLEDDEARKALEIFQKLALGYAVIEDAPDEKWADVIPGEYSIGDTVRVRADAYDGAPGLRHNGKRGRVTAVHQSKAVVLYDDAKNSEESFYHLPEKLQRLL